MRSRETDWRTLRMARPSSENVLRPHHGLLTDRDRPEPELAITVEMHVGCADDRQPPAAGADETAQLREQVVDLGLVADGIAADECRPGDDAVREEGAPRGREQVALVAAQREEGEAVAPVGLDERPRDSPLPDRLYDGVAERSQPEVEREEAEGEAETEERVAGAVREVAAAQLRPDAEGGDPHERCAETEQRLNARRVAGNVEAAPPANERHEQEQRDRRLLEVEALGEVRDGGRDDDRDGKLPRAPCDAWRASPRARSGRGCRRWSALARLPASRAGGRPGRS